MRTANFVSNTINLVITDSKLWSEVSVFHWSFLTTLRFCRAPFPWSTSQFLSTSLDTGTLSTQDAKVEEFSNKWSQWLVRNKVDLKPDDYPNHLNCSMFRIATLWVCYSVLMVFLIQHTTSYVGSSYFGSRSTGTQSSKMFRWEPWSGTGI